MIPSLLTLMTSQLELGTFLELQILRLRDWQWKKKAQWSTVIRYTLAWVCVILLAGLACIHSR